jgi:D-alanyl-D-alanine carboxypeptidase (penicillin-binding protein 5/6)
MKHRATKDRWWRRHKVLSIGILVVIVVLGAVGGLVYSALSTPIGLATFTSHLATSVTAPGVAPPASWPAKGEGAFTVPSLGVSADSPTQTPVPIGSVTKLMTAWIILNDHPLAPGEQGPSITVSDANVTDFQLEELDGQSVVAVAAGESLSEYQLMEGLLIHSANDFAGILSVFDDGSMSGFVAKMNAQAAALGMSKTHYSDVSGLDPGSVSTPHDQLILATQLLKNPVFASIVSMRSVTLPVAGTVTTYQPLLGTDGVVGVKSGLTSQAGGCDVMAVNWTVAGQVVQILTSVTGQTGSNRLGTAGAAALAIAKSVEATIQSVPVALSSVPAGTIGWPKSSVAAGVDHNVVLPAWPGQRISVVVRQTQVVTSGLPKGHVVAALFSKNGDFAVRAPIATLSALHEPTLLQRVV